MLNHPFKPISFSIFHFQNFQMVLVFYSRFFFAKVRKPLTSNIDRGILLLYVLCTPFLDVAQIRHSLSASCSFTFYFPLRDKFSLPFLRIMCLRNVIFLFLMVGNNFRITFAVVSTRSFDILP